MTVGAFTTPYDIANRALQLLGVPRITNFSDVSRQATETGFAYDKARRAELRRFVWTFSTRRAVLRPVTATTKALTFPAYAAGTTYVAGDVALYNNMLYTSLVASNTGNTPGVGGFSPAWEAYFGPLQADTYDNAATYYPGDMVVSAGTVYRYINHVAASGNAVGDATHWMAPQGVTTSSLFFSGAIGFDPPTGSTTRNLYRLPANYLRLTPQDPKQPAVARLNTTAGMQFNDWEIEAGYLSSAATSGSLILRFVADTQIVTAMEEMFCEAVACRIALGLSELLTQRPDLMQEIAALYQRLISEAQAISAIEAGSTEPDIMTVAGQNQGQGGGAAPLQGAGRLTR